MVRIENESVSEDYTRGRSGRGFSMPAGNTANNMTTTETPDPLRRKSTAPVKPDLPRRLAVRECPPTAPVGRQRWDALLFAHWNVDAAAVQRSLPPGLFVDTHDGGAYVGIVPFFMQRVRPVWLPPLPWVSWFLELNVRTYVHDANGQPGVWFYSLDCNQPLAVMLARRWFHLPYHHARMSAGRRGPEIQYHCRRRIPDGPRCDYVWSPGAFTSTAKPGSLEFFLLERYMLFAADGAGRLHQGRVHHAPYQIHVPQVQTWSSDPLRQAGFEPEGAPVSLLGAHAVDVAIHPLTPVKP